MMHVLATPQVTAIERILDTAHKEGRGVLFENEVYTILAILGLLTPQHRLVRSETEITAPFLAQFGSKRIVLKIVSSAISHKQKESGVRIIYKDLAFVKFSFTQMRQSFLTKFQALTRPTISLVKFWIQAAFPPISLPTAP